MKLLVRRAGFLTSVQDLGRTGGREHGVSVGGALDRHALRVANVLVGNDDFAAGLEMGAGKFESEFTGERLVAWCGDGLVVAIKGTPVPPGYPACATRGETLTVAATGDGARGWLAISGGIDVPVVLGSRSTDLRAGFGGHHGRALRDGDELPLGERSPLSQRLARALTNCRIADWSALSHWVNRGPVPAFLRVVAGADAHRFSADTRALFASTAFTVTSQSDRMGARLSGPRIERSDTGDLFSEAVAPGTIQVPPDGQPILLLNDCQTIGGYPKIAHVISVDQNTAARLRPGDAVHFHEVTLAKAHELLRRREADFTWFRAGVAVRYS